MVTTYDYPTARALSANPDVDIALVGDSLAQVCLGYDSTTQLTLDEMIHHCAAVARGSTHPFRVADMPFGSFHVSVEDAARNAIRLCREGRVEGVKLEGGHEIVPIVRRLTEIGIPVMAHVGLCPQRHVAMSGYRVQGKNADGAECVIRDAVALEEAGAFAMVVEAVPQELGRLVTEAVSIPTIGIGAGRFTSGQVCLGIVRPLPVLVLTGRTQVLVWDDIMGTWPGHKAKFVRQFADVKSARDRGLQSYTDAVRDGSFPNESESYTMDPVQLSALISRLQQTEEQ